MKFAAKFKNVYVLCVQMWHGKISKGSVGYPILRGLISGSDLIGPFGFDHRFGRQTEKSKTEK